MGIEIEEPELVIEELMKLADEGEVTITRRHLKDLLAVVRQLEQEKAALMAMLETLTEGMAEEEEDLTDPLAMLRKTMQQYQQPQTYPTTQPFVNQPWTINYSSNTTVDPGDKIQAAIEKLQQKYYGGYDQHGNYHSSYNDNTF